LRRIFLIILIAMLLVPGVALAASRNSIISQGCVMSYTDMFERSVRVIRANPVVVSMRIK